MKELKIKNDNTFEVGQHIYIKKYYGDELKADTSKSYEIVSIKNTMHENDSTKFIKNCVLDNGRTYPIYTYDIINKERIYYIESIPFIRSCCCGF